jgi:hypothetical protein
MANRITERQLDAICGIINRMTSNPEEAYGHYKANIGNYHISHAYGGVSLHQMISTGGGVRDVFSCGYIPKRDLASRMYAYINGLEANKG